MYSSGMGDESGSDSFGQYPPSSWKEVSVNDDEEPFGLMDNDSSPQPSERVVLGMKSPG